jgi:hypothetical protein
MFQERDLTCHFGQISSTTDQSVIIHTDKSDITIARANLLRIERGRSGTVSPYQSLFVVYSGRSSWADIISFIPFLSKSPSYEVSMLIATSDGKIQKGNLKDATETEIILRDSFGKETRIPKTQVSWVDYLRIKPLSDDQEFYAEELAWMVIFDPVLYPRMFHLGDRMPVRLYDCTLPEDNSPTQCR